ncbi:MAG: hypothetical protein ACRCZS_01870 [Chroococcidiopsis sp.]
MTQVQYVCASEGKPAQIAVLDQVGSPWLTDISTDQFIQATDEQRRALVNDAKVVEHLTALGDHEMQIEWIVVGAIDIDVE